jgi:hypothetical protein
LRPALLLLALLAIAAGPTLSQAVPPTTILLACDTVSTSPLQIHFQFAEQNPQQGLSYFAMYLCPKNPATHILSCSTTAAGASCGPSPICAGGIIWNLSAFLLPGQTVGPFDFVADQSPACFAALFEDPTLAPSGRNRPEGYTVETLCFSCDGVQAVPVLPSTWGNLKAHYR